MPSLKEKIVVSRMIVLRAGVNMENMGGPIILEAGHTRIKGITVDNGNSTIQVNVWRGFSPNVGFPFIVLPKWQRSFAVHGFHGVYIDYIGTPTADGTIYVAITSEGESAFGQSGP